MQLLHVIDNLGAGGPARSMLSFVKHAEPHGQDVRHTVVSLGPTFYMPLMFAAKQLGVELLRSPDRAVLVRLAKNSDVVLLHFWNTPLVWDYLAFAPAARTVVWSKVLGVSFPQKINRLLVDRAARFVPTAVPSTEVESGVFPQDVELNVVPGLADFDRLKDIKRHDHEGFNVDYVGTLGAGKLHPDFVRIMDDIDIPQMSVRVFGGKPDQWLVDAVRSANQPDRFQFPGFVEDVQKIFSTSDVFGYPLTPDTYATSDKSLQEAMYAGVPPVIFPHGGLEGFIRNGQTGIIARNSAEFRAAVEWLYRHPDKRLEMGCKAQDYARTQFDPVPHAARLMEIIVVARKQSRKTMLEGSGRADAGCLFLMSHGFDEANALAAVQVWGAGEQRDLDNWILQLTEKAASLEGGLYHWYKHFGDNETIGWWTAISLATHGRLERAARVLDAIACSGALFEKRASARRLIASALKESNDKQIAEDYKLQANFLDDFRELLWR